MRSALLATTFLSLAASATMAADISSYAPPPIESQVATVRSWTGVYGGINAGYGWGSAGASGAPISYDALILEPGAPPADGSLGVASRSFDADGFVGGVQIGANMQYERFVFGVEADLQWADMDSGSAVLREFDTGDGFGLIGTWDPVLGDTLDGSITASASLEWFGTVRGRIGLPFDNLLPYVTGGLAYGRVEANAVLSMEGAYVPVPFDFTSTTSADNTHVGWTIGAGLEARLTDRISLKAEYLYVDLGSKTYNLAFRGPDGGSATYSTKIDIDAHIARVGLNYSFSSGM